MTDQLCLLICPHFMREAEAVVDSLGVEDLMVSSYPADCNTPGVGGRQFDDLVRSLHPDNRKFYLVGGCFLPPSVRKNLAQSPLKVFYQESCFYLLAGKDLVEQHFQVGNYLVTPGWLDNWQGRLEKWGFDQQTARAFFQESTRKFVLLDTGIDDQSLGRLTEMSNYIGLPFQVERVGLEHFRLIIHNIYLNWKLKQSDTRVREVLDLANRKSADYSMALDFLARLARITNESETIEGILDLTKMLFGSNKTTFIRESGGQYEIIEANAPIPIITSQTPQDWPDWAGSDYSWSKNGDGFTIRIGLQDDTIGILKIEEITFPEYKRHYLNLALAIAPLFSLVISNARTYQKLGETEQNLRQEKEFVERLVQTAQTIILVLDMMGKILWANPYLEDISGMPISDLRGCDWLMRIPTEIERPRAELALKNTLKDKPCKGDIFSIRAMDHGEVISQGIPVEWYSRLLSNSLGETIGSLWIGQDITERLRAEAEIKAALQEKEILLKEIYHRVKNNLTVVAALLSLQARSIQDPEAKLAFQESEKRVQTMALIHQELYKSSSLAQIDFSDYLYKLISNLYSAYRTRPDVKLIIDVEKINLSVQTAIH